MASFTKKPNGTWLAQVRHKAKDGRPAVNKSAVFDRKTDAQAWATKVEAEYQAMRAGVSPRIPFGDVLRRYLDEVTATKRGAKTEGNLIGRILRTPLADVLLPDLSEVQFEEWARVRRLQISEDSVRREWNTLSHVLTVAVRRWRLLPENFMLRLEKPAASPSRTRRVPDEDVAQICFAAGYTLECVPDMQVQRVAAAFCFALETAMRVGEITAMRRDEVFLEKRFVHLPQTKNGYPRDVPLSRRAAEILRQVMAAHTDDRVFALSRGSADAQFRKLKAMALIDDLHFHDSRREALTRLAKVYSPMELAKISGHRDLRILLNTYYAPSAAELAEKME